VDKVEVFSARSTDIKETFSRAYYLVTSMLLFLSELIECHTDIWLENLELETAKSVLVAKIIEKVTAEVVEYSRRNFSNRHAAKEETKLPKQIHFSNEFISKVNLLFSGMSQMNCENYPKKVLFPVVITTPFP